MASLRKTAPRIAVSLNVPHIFPIFTHKKRAAALAVALERFPRDTGTAAGAAEATCFRTSFRDAMPSAFRVPRPRCGLAMTRKMVGFMKNLPFLQPKYLNLSRSDTDIAPLWVPYHAAIRPYIIQPKAEYHCKAYAAFYARRTPITARRCRRCAGRAARRGCC